MTVSVPDVSAVAVRGVAIVVGCAGAAGIMVLCPVTDSHLALASLPLLVTRRRHPLTNPITPFASGVSL